ncbi:MAG TPA: oligosaccharide flippase family protein [Gammaproteobacteria bacterium]|nr:oligosaccharide flippase family protein [Gammaproteobacteria bacterium]
MATEMRVPVDVGEGTAKKLLQRASLVAAGTLYQQGVAFASGLIVARVIGAADYGVFALARSLVDVAATVTRLGLDIGLQRFFGETSIPLNKVSRGVMLRRLRLCAAATALIVVFAVALGLGRFLEAHVYRYTDFAAVLLCLSLTLPFANDVSVLGGAYRGILNLTPSVLVECILQPTVRLAAIGALLWMGWRLWAVAYGTTFAACLACLVLALASRGAFRDGEERGHASWTDALRVVRYSIVLAGAVLVTSLTTSIDVLVLAHFTSAEEVGRYSLVKTLLLVMGVLGAAFVQGLGTTVAALHFRGDGAAMRRAMVHSVTWIARTTLPVFVVFVFWGADLMPLFGPTFESPPTVVRSLAAAQLAFVVLGPCGWALSMTGKHLLELGVLLLGLAVAAVLCWLAVPAFGEAGAAVAMAASTVATNALRVAVVRRRYGAWPFGGEIIWLTAVSLALGWISNTAVAAVGLPPPWRAFAGAVCFLIAFVAVLWRFVLDDTEREALLGSVRGAQLRFFFGARA